MNRATYRTQSGMSLVEVLVSILIFSIGVLGMVALQTRASQTSSDAENRNRAALLANEAVSLMWTYQTSNLAALPNNVYSNWQARVTMPATPNLYGLPNGVGSVTTTAGTPPITTVTITWTDPNKPLLTGKTYTSQYVTSLSIN